jgi:dinuclear metal center YbgI/SA1388 family protein
VAELNDVVRYLNEELRIGEVPDYESALNGLQLANAGTVSKIAAAVDFSTTSIDGALRQGADLLIVHHGMFWAGAERIVGPVFQRLQRAMGGGLAIYSSHLPLDVHPTFGNNALFARELQLEPSGTFGRYKTIEVGVTGSAKHLRTFDLYERVQRHSAAFSTTAVCTSAAKDRETRRWAIITGAGASSETLREAAERGIDTLVVGEGPHHTAVAAMELDIALIYAGHYASEVFGVRALADHVAKRFDLAAAFVDVPTGR